MQKKLIVLAIAAMASTSAFADSTVALYGIADAAVVNLAGSNQHSQLLAASNGLATSRFGLNAAEDLGDGLKAIVNLEYGVDMESASTIGAGGAAAARQQLLGLTGGFGTVATGYLQTVANDFSKYDVVGGSSVSALQNVTKGAFLLNAKGADVRATNAIAYISPNLEGFTVALNYATSLNAPGDAGQPSANAATNKTAYLGSVTYAAGPLSVNLSYASNASYNVITPATKASVGVVGGAPAVIAATAASTANVAADAEFGLGLSYDAGVAKIDFTYQSNSPSATGASSYAAYSVGAVVPVSSDAVAVSYAANSASNGLGATGYTLGYLHPMSKTTTMYAAYTGVTNGSSTAAYSVDNGAVANATLGAAGSSSMVALGLQKKF